MKSERTYIPLTDQVKFELSPSLLQMISHWSFSIQLTTPPGRGTKDEKYVGKFARVLLIKLVWPTFDNYNPATILSIISSQIDLALQRGTQVKAKVLHRQRTYLASQSSSQTLLVANISHRDYFWLREVDF